MKIKYNIPQNTSLLKISSFYINLNDDINRFESIKMIARYIFSNYYDVEVDIICIQGINNNKLVKIMIDEILHLSRDLQIPVNIVPKVNYNDLSNTNSIQLTWINSSDIENIDTNNIIISKYPIITTSRVNLNESFDEKLMGSRKATIANINVDGYLISIFNLILSEDFLGVSNAEYRKSEIEKLFKYVKANNIEMNKMNERYKLDLINKNVNIICGNFNIHEFKNCTVNSELIDIFKYIKALDTFRITNINNDNTFTNTRGFRDCYILLLLNELDLDNVNMTSSKILKYCLDVHGITIIKSEINNNIKSNNCHPIETIFLLNKQERKSVI